MQKLPLTAALFFAISLSAFAGTKVEGKTTLKDSQPYGVEDKEHKHQAYDLAFEAKGKSYTCRTDPNKSMDATEFVVGTDVTYKIDGNKAKIKTPQNKEVGCKIVRVEALPNLQ
jgi:uncharacterized protein YcfJ